MVPGAVVLLLDGRSLSDEALARYAAWLGPSETERLSRFVRPARRRQFIAGRALLRRALGDLTGLQAPAIRLRERPGDAPLLDLPGGEYRFSLSHSGDWVACAVSASTSVGLDIEMIDPERDVGALASQAFMPSQLAWLAGRPDGTRLRDFYTMWCELEARIKLKTDVHHSYVLSHPNVAAVLCTAEPLGAVPELIPAPLPL